MLAWPHRGGRNPYTHLLYRAVLDRTAPPPVEVAEFRVATGWLPAADVVHVHWPESSVESPRAWWAALKTLVVLLDLWVQRLRGAVVVWTCHNLHSHDQHHPRIERLLRRGFDRLLGGVLHLSHASVEQLLAADPSLRRVPHVVVPHGHYRPLHPDPPSRAAARARLHLEQDAVVLAFVGTLRPHKDVAGLVDSFASVAEPRARLVVAGAADDPALAAAVTAAADADDRVHVRIGWLPEDELVAHVRASDAVVLPYREFHNSGVAVLALSLARPVVVPSSPVMQELADLVGHGWVRLVDGDLDADALASVVADLGDRPTTPPATSTTTVDDPAPDPIPTPAAAAPDLSALDWGPIADATVAFYRDVARVDERPVADPA